MSAYAYDWTDLDKAVHPHYGRGKPPELLDAEYAVELAWGKYDRAVDNFYDKDEGTKEEIVALRTQAEATEATYQDLYNKIYGRIENGQSE